MRQTHLFGKTIKETPSDASNISTQYLLRAGYIRESVAGRYYMMPLGMMVQDNIMAIIESEMDTTGAQKIITPTLHPLELWKETNRTSSAGFELMRVTDRRGAEFALGGTAEEMIVDLVRKFPTSYRDLPFNLYQFSQKFRDEMRARGGLLRVREFMMKDAYSFHNGEEDFKKEYKIMWDTYTRIFKLLGLETIVVESDNGYIGGDYCHEFVVESDVGESRFLMTEDGTYAAHEDVAVFTKEQKNVDEPMKDMEKVDAPRGTTMQDGVDFHHLPLWQQIKDVMFVDQDGKFILSIIRGDMDVNEMKLKHIIGAVDLRMATDEEIRSLGSEPGFISPVEISDKVTIVADDSLRTMKNAYCGANKKDIDLLNLNIDRDYKPNHEGDIAMVQEGFLSKEGKVLIEKRGIEVGNIFQLGYYYSEKMNATYTNKDGKEEPFYMGCYGIGIGRTLATIVEKYNDENGIIWPENIAPFSVHLVSLCRDEEDIKKADELYDNFKRKGIKVLYDDRTDVRPGQKFADSDLIGIPKRIIISPKTLENNNVEVKMRNSQDVEMVDIKDILN